MAQNAEAVDGPDRRPSDLLSEFNPERHPLVFSLVAATLWALAIGAFATVGHFFGPEGERGSWGEVLGAVAGNLAVAFSLCVIVSLVLWARQRRARG